MKLITLLIIILLIFYILVKSKYITKKENFEQCVYLPKNKKINSLNVEVSIDRKKYDYEFPLSVFRREIKKADLRKKNFVRDLNKIEFLKLPEYVFEQMYKIGNEIIVYRRGKHCGFHVIFENDKPIVKGIVNSYDILASYTKQKKRSLKDILQLHLSDPYSAMSSSAEI